MEKKKKQIPPTAGTDVPTAAPTEPTAPRQEKTAPAAPRQEKGEKAPLKIRGTLTILDAEAHDYEFRAQRTTGESSQQVVRQNGQSKLYRTTGERKPKMVAHLSVSADSPDPVADLHQQLQRVTTGMETKLPPLLRGRVLLNDGGIIVVHNQRQQQVECRMTMATDGMASLQQKLIKNLQTLNQCFVINQDSLAPRKS